MMNSSSNDYLEQKSWDYSRVRDDEEQPNISINSPSSSRAVNSVDEIVVIQMSSLNGTSYSDDIDADENYNLRTKKLKETTKLLRSISNPGQTNLPFTIKEKYTYYEMEPRDRQFVSRMMVVVATFIIFLLTIMIVFYILTENGSNK